MNEIHNKVRQAQRRLWLNRWLGHLGWSLAGSAGLFVLFVLIVRLAGVWHDEERAMRWATGTLAGAGLMASLLWTYATRENLSLAAARLDEAAGLKERLSTALAFAASPDPFARAAVVDADHVSRLVTPRMHLPIRVPSSASYAGGALFVALISFWLLPAVDLLGRQAALAEQAGKQQEMQKARAEVKPVVDRLRQIQEKHPETKKDTPEIGTLQTAKLDTPSDFKREALKQVNVVAAKLDSQKNQAGLAKVDELKSMLRQLAAQPTPPSVVGTLSKSLAQGDFKAAQSAMEAIRREVGKEPKSAEDKARAEQLRTELKKVSDQLGKIVESNNRLKDQLRQMNLSEEDINKLIDKLNKGQLSEIAKQLADKGLFAGQIEKIMKQMAKSAEARKAVGQLAQAFAKAVAQQPKQPGDKNQQDRQARGSQEKEGNQSQQVQQSSQGQQGSQGQADQEGSGSDGLQQASAQLAEMESLQQQMAELNAAGAELKELKEQLGDAGENNGSRTGQRGVGIGRVSAGHSGTTPQTTAFTVKTERAHVRAMRGAISDQQFVHGEQYKGEVTNEFVEAALGAREDLTDANRQKSQPRHIKLRQAQYFSHVDSDMPKDQVEAARKKLKLEAQPTPPSSGPAN